MKHQSEFSGEQQEPNAARQQTQSPAALEFATAEELLRHDAKQTTVPAEIARRLQKSAGELPKPKAAWWKRWLGGSRP
jgi:hypothetical protein